MQFAGSTLGPHDLDRLRRLARDHRAETRLDLARRACKLFGWVRPNGAFPERSCLNLLVRLEREGVLELPPARARARRQRALPKLLQPGFLVEQAPAYVPRIDPAAPLEVRLIREEERAGWQAYLVRYHYLGFRSVVGESLKYAAFLGDDLVALLLFGAATLYNEPRDRYIGWGDTARVRGLPFVANNARFLILPWVKVPHLASRVLARTLRRLSADWQAVYGHPVHLVETFVDKARFKGTCYRASNWRYLGDSKGYSRSGTQYWEHGQPKAVFVYPLHRRAQALLCAAEERWKPAAVKREGKKTLDVEKLPLDGAGGLFEVLQGVTDVRKRKGRRHRIESVLAVSICAVLTGAKSFEAIAQWAADQSDEIRARLRCRLHGGRRVPPSEPTVRRVLRKIDAREIDEKLSGWLARWAPLAGEALAMDGKTLRGSADDQERAVHLLAAVVHGQGTVVMQTRVPGKTNEITCVRPLLDKLDIRGTVVTADALLTQVDIARYLVEEKGADYVFTVKDNQPTLRQDIADLFTMKEEEARRRQQAGREPPAGEAFPPSAPDGGEGPRPARGAPDLGE